MSAKSADEKFARDWIVDFSTYLIKRRHFSWFRRSKEALLKTKYPVISLYRFSREREASWEGMSHPHIIDSDYMPVISGIATRFALNDKWDISQKDRKYLIFGPLTKGNQVLVPSQPHKMIIISLWEVAKIISTIGGVAGLAYLIYIIYQLIAKPSG